MKADLYLEIIERSYGSCEAMIKLPRAWTRCGKKPIEVHHALTKARGGRHLDAVNESYHLIALCREHHHDVDEYGEKSGLVLQGSVTMIHGEIIYIGPDEYLTSKYGGRNDHSDDASRQGQLRGCDLDS